jgi:hypothetical protein
MPNDANFLNIFQRHIPDKVLARFVMSIGQIHKTQYASN